MLHNDIFYHGLTRKIIMGFGSLFSSIRLKRSTTDGLDTQTIAIPIAYAPKEKWLVRLEQDATQEHYTSTSLPRISFEIVGVQYDAQRHVSRAQYISCQTNLDAPVILYTPVPYNLNIMMYVLTKTAEDGFQIVEQILPFFAPEVNLKLKLIEAPELILDIPVILNSSTMNDEYEGDFNSRRLVTWALSFTIKSYFFGPLFSKQLVKSVSVDVTNMEETSNSTSFFIDTTDLDIE